MDLIGVRIVQPPEAVAHGTDNHTAQICKIIPVSVMPTGIYFILFCKYYNLGRYLCYALFFAATWTFDFYSFQVIHNSKDLSATLVDASRFCSFHAFSSLLDDTIINTFVNYHFT